MAVDKLHKSTALGDDELARNTAAGLALSDIGASERLVDVDRRVRRLHPGRACITNALNLLLQALDAGVAGRVIDDVLALGQRAIDAVRGHYRRLIVSVSRGILVAASDHVLILRQRGLRGVRISVNGRILAGDRRDRIVQQTAALAGRRSAAPARPRLGQMG